MPNINLPISDVMSSVERPVIYDVIRQLMQLTGISDKTLIRFYGEDGKGAQLGSTITSKNLPHMPNLWPHMENVSIEVEEDYDPNAILNMAVTQNENPFIFVDEALKVSIKPAYSGTDVAIKVVYKSKDKNQAQKWRNDVRTRLAQGRQINLHKLHYSYALPRTIEALLSHIYELREKVGGYGDTIGDWWGRCASPRITKQTTQAGTQAVLAVAETQSMVQGVFDFDIPPKPDKSEAPDVWEVSFSYRFKYEKPIAINARYPITVHQQPLGERFLLANRYDAQDDILKQMSLSNEWLSHFSGDMQLAKRLANKGVTMPIFDDWLPQAGTVPSCTVRVFTALAGISKEDKRFLLDLKDLGDFQLVDEILQFMSHCEYPYMTGHASSIFQLTVYEDYDVLHASQFELTADLKLMAKRDLDLRKVYHVRLGLHAQLVGLQASAVNRIRTCGAPGIAERLARALNGALSESGHWSDLKKSQLNAHDLALLGLEGGSMPRVLGAQWLFQTLFISARRMQDYEKTQVTPYAIERPFVNV